MGAFTRLEIPKISEREEMGTFPETFSVWFQKFGSLAWLYFTLLNLIYPSPVGGGGGGEQSAHPYLKLNLLQQH